MDKREREQIIVNEHLEKLMNDAQTAEDLGFSKKFIEYYEQKGFNVKEFKIRREYKERLLLSINYN
jgi:hypothetical protein